MSNRPFNFSAGPAILPEPVFERAGSAVRELRMGGHAADGEGIGLSVLEVSHRGKPFDQVHQAALELARSVLQIPDTHEILFLQGGASLQFCMVPMNLGEPGKTACYVDTGTWSSKAIKESKILGETKVVASSKETNFDRIPALPAGSEYAGASYLHVTTNNTIYGTEYAEIPKAEGDVPLVVDASSHIGSRPMDLSRVALGYAGAQKNLGPSGLTLVYIRKDLLDRGPNGVVPNYLRYKTHAEKQSLYNTPNTFGILVLKLVLEWMKDAGGVQAMEKHNRDKAAKLYSVLDGSSLYKPHAQKDSRSLMNVTWTLDGKDEAEIKARTEKFIADAKAAGLDGLKGHRSVGGCRASIYNAFPAAGVDALCEFMAEFERNA